MTATGLRTVNALPIAAGRGKEPLTSWAEGMRLHLQGKGVSPGAVTGLNAAYFSRKRPRLEPMVDAAACTRTGVRRDTPLGGEAKAGIMAALGKVDDANPAIVLEIARNLTLVSKNHAGGEFAAGEMVGIFGDNPGMAMICSRILTRLSTAVNGNEPGFTELVMRIVERADRKELMNTLWLVWKITDIMAAHNVPMLALHILERSSSVDDALNRLGRLLPESAGPGLQKRLDRMHLDAAGTGLPKRAKRSRVKEAARIQASIRLMSTFDN